METNFKAKKTATAQDLKSGYFAKEKKTKSDFVKAQAKESANLIKQFGRGDKRNWY